VDAALAMGRKLMETVVNIVKPARLGNGVWKRKSGIIQRKGSVDRAGQGPLRVWKP